MPSSHPPSSTLDLYARAELSPGAALVVELHVKRCAHCRTLLADDWAMEPSDGFAAKPPEPLRWLWAGWGVRISFQEASAALGERLYYVRARPGASLPQHSHEAAERLVVLQGAFVDGEHRYEAGDFVEQNEATWHHPVAARGAPCLCLVAAEGPLRLRGVARLIQPFLGV